MAENNAKEERAKQAVLEYLRKCGRASIRELLAYASEKTGASTRTTYRALSGLLRTGVVVREVCGVYKLLHTPEPELPQQLVRRLRPHYKDLSHGFAYLVVHDYPAYDLRRKQSPLQFPRTTTRTRARSLGSAPSST
jgi:hypothetical protein